jgi:hypothetical protein
MIYVRTGKQLSSYKNLFVYRVDWRAMERNKYAPWGRKAY